MQIHLGSKHLIADVAVALDVTGREHLVIVAKSTWSIPAPGQRPRPLKPEPLVMADEFYGEPGESALRYGSDFARFKPQCDVLFDACAHAPWVDGAPQPVKHMDVAVQVGTMKKQVRVHGPRRWQRILGLTQMGDTEPFTKVPLHYGMAFGGTRWYDKGDDKLCEALLANPVGLGYAGRHTSIQVHGLSAPQLEAPGKSVSSPNGGYQPQALSPLPANFPERLAHAGTYDEAWEQDLAPFLPEDFDDRFHQLAPLDQQIPYPKGGEPVVLRGLLPNHPVLSFSLPRLAALDVRVLRTDYSVEPLSAVVDTLYFETEAQRFSAIWRCATPLRRRLQEIDTLALGPVDHNWWQARRLGLEQEGGCPGCGEQPPNELWEREHA
jgi:hypothetical protein